MPSLVNWTEYLGNAKNNDTYNDKLILFSIATDTENMGYYHDWEIILVYRLESPSLLIK